MYLSKLVFNSAKNATDYGDASFTYLTFIDGEAKNNPDYSSSIDKTILDVNAFLQRLSQLGKVPSQIAEVENADIEDGVIDLKKQGIKARQVIAVFKRKTSSSDSAFILGGYANAMVNDFITFPYHKNGTKLYVEGYVDDGESVFIQYRPIIPMFDDTDIPYCEPHYDEDGNIDGYTFNGTTYTDVEELYSAIEEKDIELTDAYGIPEDAMPLCMDWCKSRQNEMEMSAAHALLIETESRIKDLQNDETLYHQQSIKGVL